MRAIYTPRRLLTILEARETHWTKPKKNSVATKQLDVHWPPVRYAIHRCVLGEGMIVEKTKPLSEKRGTFVDSKVCSGLSPVNDEESGLTYEDQVENRERLHPGHDVFLAVSLLFWLRRQHKSAIQKEIRVVVLLDLINRQQLAQIDVFPVDNLRNELF